MSKIQSHSSYWMNDDMWEDEDHDVVLSKDEISVQRIAKLSSTRRAVSNFVNILTGRNDIEIKFSSGQTSYTTGDVVVIAADDNPDNFDTMVGLALHEGSHILLSDFTFLRQIHNLTDLMRIYDGDYSWNTRDIESFLPAGDPNMTVFRSICHPALAKLLPQFDRYTKYQVGVHPGTLGDAEVTRKNYRERSQQYISDLMDIMNILEDRRIDQYVYRNAGGYRPYYDALYEKYFLNSDIGKNLRWNASWRELTVENYKNRLLFAIHPDSNPDAMPGLRKIIEMMDITHIDRLSPSKSDSWKNSVTYDDMPVIWKVANEIYVHILRFAALAKKNQSTKTGTQQSSDNSQASSDEVENATSDLPNLDQTSDFTPRDVDAPEKTKAGKDKPTKFNSKRGEKAVTAAKQVLNGNLKKKKATKKEIESAEALEKAQAKMIDLKGDGIPGGQCMVTRRMSDKLFGESWFIFGNGYYNRYGNEEREKSIAMGRRMGAILEHKLQVRNDPVHTKNTRLQHGNLDRRLLAQLGMDITSVFQKSRIDTFKPAMLHLTLDASGSMGGKKWERVMTVATALAYVGTKVRNVDTVISIRGGNDMPIVSVVFDSRKDKFHNWIKWASKLYPNGATPEGLCYKAIMGLITECASTHDVYFINFSDGEPGFSLNIGNKTKGRRRWYSNTCSYGGELAVNHTRQQIQTMRDSGIKILSYFITDSRYADHNRTMEDFRKMYGEDAVNVNIESSTEVLRTLNRLLLARG